MQPDSCASALDLERQQTSNNCINGTHALAVHLAHMNMMFEVRGIQMWMHRSKAAKDVGVMQRTLWDRSMELLVDVHCILQRCGYTKAG